MSADLNTQQLLADASYHEDCAHTHRGVLAAFGPSKWREATASRHERVADALRALVATLAAEAPHV